MKLRSQSIDVLKIAIPEPTEPMTFSRGTSQSSKVTSLIGEVRRPILWNGSPTRTPGVLRSTTTALMPPIPVDLPVRANTTNTSATGALVMNVFAPRSTIVSAPMVAEVRIAKASDPVSGSVMHWTAMIDPSAMPGR
jgi:hypothetical protein